MYRYVRAYNKIPSKRETRFPVRRAAKSGEVVEWGKNGSLKPCGGGRAKRE